MAEKGRLEATPARVVEIMRRTGATGEITQVRCELLDGQNKGRTILNFCTRRCEKSMVALNRNPLKVAWTLRFRKFRGKAKGAEAAALEEEVKKAKDQKTPTFKDAAAEAKKEEKK